MRMIVFFDLPVTTVAKRRAYVKFRKHLIRSGFAMMQQSVYCKLILNPSAAESVRRGIEKIKPNEGVIQILLITEKQYSRIESLVDDVKSDVIQTDERTLLL